MPKHFTDLRLSNSSVCFSDRNKVAKDKLLVALSSSIHDLVEKDKICAEMYNTSQSERRLSKNESSP